MATARLADYYLRLSVTNHCNLRCFYCRPAVDEADTTSSLSQREIGQLAELLAGFGVRRIRLTGGEPLLRPDICEIISRLRQVSAIHDLALTTNGTKLAPVAKQLAAAGLHRVNVSMDTLSAASTVFDGIEAALAANLHPVKINVVVIKGFNDGEVLSLARLTLDWPVHVRFIEVMPIGAARQWAAQRLVPTAQVRAELGKAGELLKAKGPVGGGPAFYYRLPHSKGSVGFISSVTCRSCTTCNRLRLTADGYLRPCLLNDAGVDLRHLLQQGEEAALRSAVHRVLRLKAGLHPSSTGIKDRMYNIGG